MRKPGMIQLDVSQFSSVVGAVQRTGSLTGGEIRGLPNGAVVGGLVGVNSFASSIAEAQKEFQLGRPHASLERIRQLDGQFTGIVGRWNSTVMSVISGARQGRQGVSLQKLNEVKNAQVRMQQLTGPVTKAFRDLITALEHEITMQGRGADESETDETNEADLGNDPDKTVNSEFDGLPFDDETLGELVGQFRVGERLRLERAEDQRVHIVPKLSAGESYVVVGFDPPRVIRIDQLQAKSVVATDTLRSRRVTIQSRQLAGLIKKGVWRLEQKSDEAMPASD